MNKIKAGGWELFAIQINSRSLARQARYVPIEQVATLDDGSFLWTDLPLENTRHRYPWLCSLRSKGSGTKHYCGVTLLR